MPSKSKIPAGKIQINVLISEDVYKLLIEVAPAIHGKFKGAISRVVEEALRLYLTQKAPQGGTVPPDTHAHSTHSSVRTVYRTKKTKIEDIIMKFYSVLDHIKKLKGYSQDDIICEITHKELEAGIQGVIGIDRRTIDTYIDAFTRQKLLLLQGGVYKVLVYPECREE